MKMIFCKATFLAIALALLLIAGQSCNQPGAKAVHSDSLAIRKSLAPEAVLSPEEAIKKMHIENGFEVKLVASEPLTTAPVAMSFDEQGRIWVVEMQNYMPDTLGTGEDIPNGKVVILTDKNGDGVMDEEKVFLDSLVLPRAICLVENGMLVAESPKLWYYEIQQDKPVKKTLVDAAYAEGGNVEHQPNGLFRALDNWIYSANSTKRYRKKGDRWLIERTHFRGQWGICQDDQGRLFYNSNSANLLGDYFSPGFGAANENQEDVAGFQTTIVTDNRVYPVRPTPGVNRGYMEGILDDSLRLVNFTAACGPVIYNGGLFNKAYDGNAFVAEPSANLIKRDILTSHGYVTDGRETVEKKEFLASEDERFRPVSLYNGPGGALYIVDMYRGIIQHKTYLTPYLKNEIKERALTKPLSCGRIYKVAPENKLEAASSFTGDNNRLIQLLQDPNGWVRSKAQQLLVDKKDQSVGAALRAMLKDTTKALPLIHALWTMEGLGILAANDLLPLLRQYNWAIRMQALSAIPSVINASNCGQFIPELQALLNVEDTLAAPYIAFLTRSVAPFNAAAAHRLLTGLAKKYPRNSYVADAIISSLQNKENEFYQELLSVQPDTSLVISRQFKNVLKDIADNKKKSNAAILAKEFPKGAALFQAVCQTCHGPGGNGINALAPPLNNSNWVQGDQNKLISIVLYGLVGPVQVAGKLYKAPEIAGEMPGIGANAAFSDEAIAQVLSFIRASWSNKAEKINAAAISGIRTKLKDRQGAFTMDELNKLK